MQELRSQKIKPNIFSNISDFLTQANFFDVYKLYFCGLFNNKNILNHEKN
jgi:hypothetical protein